MPDVIRSTLPPEAAIHAKCAPGDFLDCYSCKSSLSVEEAAAQAFQMPGWASALMTLRNKLVAPLGLKTGTTEEELTPSAFPITFQRENEVQYGLDDSHLNFRITLLRKDGRIYMSTWVQVNNLVGRAYLTLIMPFHVLIVRDGVARVARAG